MTQNDLLNHYFEWLYGLVCMDRFADSISYRKLLMHLHSTQFRYSIPKDADRAGEGVNLRWRFLCRHDFGHNPTVLLDELDGPCSVLEMMVALAIYCEEHITDNARIGDRTGQWFWEMVVNLGLSAMNDGAYDKRIVENALDRFLDRQYDPDGRGGLFRIRNTKHDLRNVEIFYQLCWYLNTID